MEKLTLKHVAPYLPYGLKIRQIDKYTGTNIFEWNVLDINVLFNKRYGSISVKPVLRPLSELKNFEAQIMNLYDVRNPSNMATCLYDIERVIESGVEFDTSYAFVDWMFKNHFDVNKLIDRNLAISYSEAGLN